jgi:hypothetical protein
MMMTTVMKLALAAGLAAAFALSAIALASRQIQTPPDGAITTAQYCMPHEDDNATAPRVYCRDAG